MKNFILVASIFMFCSCAMIVKSNRQTVYFKGGPDKGLTKVQTPDGTYEIDGGQASYLLTRSKADIPIKVTCPDGSTKPGVVQTKFDWVAGGLGNWWTYFIGSIFDAISDKGYDIEDVSLMSYCKNT